MTQRRVRTSVAREALCVAMLHRTVFGADISKSGSSFTRCVHRARDHALLPALFTIVARRRGTFHFSVAGLWAAIHLSMLYLCCRRWPGQARPRQVESHTKPAERSSHSGFIFSIKAIFQSRFQRFRLVSRWIASGTIGYSSYHTSLFTLYRLVKTEAVPCLWAKTRADRRNRAWLFSYCHGRP